MQRFKEITPEGQEERSFLRVTSPDGKIIGITVLKGSTTYNGELNESHLKEMSVNLKQELDLLQLWADSAFIKMNPVGFEFEMKESSLHWKRSPLGSKFKISLGEIPLTIDESKTSMDFLASVVSANKELAISSKILAVENQKLVKDNIEYRDYLEKLADLKKKVETDLYNIFLPVLNAVQLSNARLLDQIQNDEQTTVDNEYDEDTD